MFRTGRYAGGSFNAFLGGRNNKNEEIFFDRETINEKYLVDGCRCHYALDKDIYNL